MRLLYLAAVIDLAACLLLNVGTLAGYDLLFVLPLLYVLTMMLYVSLLVLGFCSEARGMGVLFTPTWKVRGGIAGFNHRWVMRKLPSFTRPILYAAWAYAAVGILAILSYYATHGQVHGDRYFYAYEKSRLATPFEVRREHGLALFGFSSWLTIWLIYPALYFFFERSDRGLEA